MTKIVEISSDKITTVVENLCLKANTCIDKDTYQQLVSLDEDNPAAKHALNQIIENIKISKDSNRPLCQDTGVVVVFLEVGQDVHITGENIETAINKGVISAYQKYFFRKSIVEDSLFERKNTMNNTPAIIHTKIVDGRSINIDVSIKGGGCENTSASKILRPSDEIDGVVDFVVETIKNAGAKSCPPMSVGIGIGGNLEYSAYMAKRALIKHNVTQTQQVVELKEKIKNKLNELNIGISGYGGKNTVYNVNILTSPCHIASLPVSVAINCHSNRHAYAEIYRDRVFYDFEKFNYEFIETKIDTVGLKKVNVQNVEEVRGLKAGEQVLLSGNIITARDAAHKRFAECLEQGKDLPINLKDRIIFYAGPCPACEDEIIGPIGPTTSQRMDKYLLQVTNAGSIGSIGKGERSKQAIDTIKSTNSVYFTVVGGVASLLAKSVKSASIIAYEDLGAEAVYELTIEDFPAIVSVDSNGNTIF